MPGMATNHQIEAPPRWIPFLEPSHLNGETVTPRDRSHPLVGIDATDLHALLSQQPASLTSPAPDIQDPVAAQFNQTRCASTHKA